MFPSERHKSFPIYAFGQYRNGRIMEVNLRPPNAVDETPPALRGVYDYFSIRTSLKKSRDEYTYAFYCQ